MKHIYPILTQIFSLALMSLAFACTATPEPEEVLVKSLTLSPTSLELTEGEQAPFEATVLPENAADKSIVWTSSRESVATVTSDGIVEALSVGTAYITATNKASGKSARCEVKVASKVIHVTGIALDKTSLSMTEGEEQKLTVTITPENATDKSVVWKSGNEAVATVSDGVVRALRAGTATIQATTVDGSKTTNCNVSVDVAMGTVTLTASHITCRGADLAGKANLPQTAGTDLVFGILYSTSSGVLFGKAENLEATVFDSEYNFSCTTPVLEPETTYYYRSYISQKGEIMYGEVKSFTTLPVSSMIQTGEATDIHPKTAILSASLDLTDCNYSVVEYGFEMKQNDSEYEMYKANNLLGENYSRLFDALKSHVEYIYRAYVSLDGRTYYGEECSFTTTSVTASITAEATDIKCKTATITGKLTIESVGSFSMSAILYYSTMETSVAGLKSNGIPKTLTLDSDGAYSVDLTSLIANTKYYYAVLSSVDDIPQQSEVKDFTTNAIVASITAETFGTSCNTATIIGKLLVASEGTFHKLATLYYSTTATTVEQLKTIATKERLYLQSDGSFSASLISLASDTKYYYVVLSSVDDAKQQTEVKTFTTSEPVFCGNAVDLGLSVKWADCNIGASCPEDYGEYYAWGETEPKSSYRWETYKWCECSENNMMLTKYCVNSEIGVADNRRILELTDDVAHVRLGGNWRMPTYDDWDNLLNGCSWTWTRNFHGTGISGYIITSRRSGYTDKSIFLPAAGYLSGEVQCGPGGYYWAASLDSNNSDKAHFFLFDSSFRDRGTYLRDYGMSVRPVSD